MDKEILISYQTNKRLVERNRKKIEEELQKEIPVVSGKVSGSDCEYPYLPRRFSTEIYAPDEYEKSCKRIKEWQEGIERTQEAMKQAEQFIANVDIPRHKEILIYRYIDGLSVGEVASKLGYSKGRISQIVKNILKD